MQNIILILLIFSGHLCEISQWLKWGNTQKLLAKFTFNWHISNQQLNVRFYGTVNIRFSCWFEIYLPSTCPTIILPSSPPTAALAFLSLAYWTNAKPLCTEQPTIFPYLLKMASTSALVTSMVLRFPMKTREFSERGSVLLVTLLAIRLLVVGECLGEKRGMEGVQKIDKDGKEKTRN